MKESEVQFQTFRTIPDMINFLNRNTSMWEWWQIITVPADRGPILAHEIDYRVFYIKKYD
jgi:hypothetical protein